MDMNINLLINKLCVQRNARNLELNVTEDFVLYKVECLWYCKCIHIIFKYLQYTAYCIRWLHLLLSQQGVCNGKEDGGVHEGKDCRQVLYCTIGAK